MTRRPASIMRLRLRSKPWRKRSSVAIAEFSVIVISSMRPSRRRSSGTKPIPRAIASDGAANATPARPSTSSAPLSNRSEPNSVRTSSVRLDPISPVMQKISPA